LLGATFHMREAFEADGAPDRSAVEAWRAKMMERLTRKSVEFVYPFELGGVDGLQPPGTYDVETVEEQLDGLSFVAYRRVSTTIALRATNMATLSRQLTMIDPADLAAALDKDAEASHGKSQV